jgi:hypothetical protein
MKQAGINTLETENAAPSTKIKPFFAGASVVLNVFKLLFTETVIAVNQIKKRGRTMGVRQNSSGWGTTPLLGPKRRLPCLSL